MQLDLEAKEQFEQKFIILNLLGKGSFGFVYECVDRSDNEVYAVKVISKNNVKKSKIQCLREEAKILSNINHPNIVKVYQFVQLNTCIFLKMEIVRGGTLQQLIHKRWESEQKFTDDEAAKIMSALFNSVNYIHSVAIIHRDIKPQNILLPNEKDLDKIKMADFGLSTKLDFHYPKTATSKCGTMLYMAPEILCGYTYTKSVDIWSLSIIMYMLFNGKHPFFQSKMTSDEYKRKIKIVKFPPLNNKLAQDFISKISKVEGNERYSAQEALKHPWLTRNSDDEIPLSLHESFSGFEKSHEISLLIKSILTLKTVFPTTNPRPQTTIPDDYVRKKQSIITQRDCKSPELIRNVRSRKQLTKLNSLNLTFEKQNHQKKSKQQKMHPSTVEEVTDNPAIKKLNTIFDTLFGKRTKTQQAKTYTEGVTKSLPKENIAPVPDISLYKEKIQSELQKQVIVQIQSRNVVQKQPKTVNLSPHPPPKTANKQIIITVLPIPKRRPKKLIIKQILKLIDKKQIPPESMSDTKNSLKSPIIQQR